MSVHIENVDPHGEVALSLLREAAIDARALYPELHASNAPWPANAPLQEGGAYVVAYLDGLPLACGALRPIDSETAEVKRMYIQRDHRRRGLGRAVLAYLQREARRLGYKRLLLETGYKQLASIALYESFGFHRIPPFGEYKNDPTSVCYELYLSQALTSVRVTRPQVGEIACVVSN
jgi:putative acetyltransferase